MRTTLLDADGNPKYTNRLADESSPYLVQHAHNPVDWYPWGEEAFDKARAEDKPVFLSIGYSTCHWCHVMEHESFDNEEIASFLNDHFVSIKLDREQRPDLDDVYMTGVQMLTGQGGWPMSNFLTPDGKPFFAGTYFSPQNFVALLQQIVSVWKERREEVDQQAEEITTGIERFTRARGESQALTENLGASASAELLGRFDSAQGGFGGAPKFPNECQLLLLLEDWQRRNDPEVKHAIALTLNKMMQGGIYDHIAGGFHRYTVDAIWLVPHFEKMLYNQAQLIRVYSRAAYLTGDPAWGRVVGHTIDYVLRDMTNSDGAFYSATDADSEGEEGRFFTWTPEELDEVLAPEDVELVTSLYNVKEGGNFEGRNILHLSNSLEDYAAEHDIPIDVLLERVTRVNEALYHAREEREHPLRDEKVITAWNAMLVTALASASVELVEDAYLDTARRAVEVVWNTAWSHEDRVLWRIIYDGEVSIPGNLEDYAYLAEALLTLYEVTGETRFLERGQEITNAMLDFFWDDADGAFFLSRDADEGPMITRPKSPMDGATASGNSVALSALVKLYAATGELALEERIVAAMNAFAALLKASPSAFCYFLTAVERYQDGGRGPVSFAGSGQIRAVLLPREQGARLMLHMAPGWHVNGHTISDSSLIPTTVAANGARIDYPAGEVYDGLVSIDITGPCRDIELTLQPCNDELCLAKETLRFAFR